MGMIVHTNDTSTSEAKLQVWRLLGFRQFQASMGYCLHESSQNKDGFVLGAGKLTDQMYLATSTWR